MSQNQVRLFSKMQNAVYFTCEKAMVPVGISPTGSEIENSTKRVERRSSPSCSASTSRRGTSFSSLSPDTSTFQNNQLQPMYQKKSVQDMNEKRQKICLSPLAYPYQSCLQKRVPIPKFFLSSTNFFLKNFFSYFHVF